jgi:hypothetical protein
LIDAGCAMGNGVGVVSANSFARVENNIVAGSFCPNGSTAPSFAVLALLSDGGNELDLHSNALFGGGAGACVSSALVLDVVAGGPLPTRPLGLVRNNILLAGGCAKRFDILESSAATDPRIVENNDFWAMSGAPTALYLDEGMNDLTSIGQVNALTDITSSGNLNADPLLINSGAGIPPMSPCIDKGTSQGAPPFDFLGTPRPQGAGYDIGAVEYKP